MFMRKIRGWTPPKQVEAEALAKAKEIAIHYRLVRCRERLKQLKAQADAQPGEIRRIQKIPEAFKKAAGHSLKLLLEGPMGRPKSPYREAGVEENEATNVRLALIDPELPAVYKEAIRLGREWKKKTEPAKHKEGVCVLWAGEEIPFVHSDFEVALLTAEFFSIKRALDEFGPEESDDSVKTPEYMRGLIYKIISKKMSRGLDQVETSIDRMQERLRGLIKEISRVSTELTGDLLQWRDTLSRHAPENVVNRFNEELIKALNE